MQYKVTLYMNHTLFSPLAVVCALGALYASSSRAENSCANFDEINETALEDQASLSLNQEFVVEEVPFHSLTEQESDENEEIADDFYFDPDSGEDLSLEEGQAPAEQRWRARPLADPMLLAENNPAKSPSPANEENNSFLSLGGTYAFTHFKPHGHPSFNGNLGGVQGLYEYRPCNRIYGALKLQWRQGKTHASNATRFLVDVTAEERLGYTFAGYEDKLLGTLFSGLGYRYLGHHLKQQGNHLRFNYSEFYCPVGLFIDYQALSWFSWGIHTTWMPQIFPTVTIIPLGGARWGTTYSLGNTLVEMPFSFFGGKNKQFFLTLNPTFQYWQDGHTTAQTTTGEKLGLPSNTYFFWGADLNLGYAF